MRIHNIQFDSTFAHEYECRLLEELPSNQTPHYYPGGGQGGQDGLLVRISPRAHAPWLGLFAFGYASPKSNTGLYSWPMPDRLCVVSSGAGYLVNVNDPTEYSSLEVEPVLAVLPIGASEIIVFANYTELIAYGSTGLKWKSKRISWDGFRVTTTKATFIEGEVWNPRVEANTKFRVSLVDGGTEGGVDEQ